MSILAFFVSYSFLIVAMSVHEFAHGFVAFRLGDSTAKLSGRLTLNPLAHIDPFWTFLFPLFLFITTGGRFIFGAAKPVPINYRALHNPKKDIIWVGLSGPLANLLLAFFLSLFLRVFMGSGIGVLILRNLIVINVILGVFNLIPLPPLDGSRVVMGLLPGALAYSYARLEPYGFLILILLSMMGFLNYVVWPIVQFFLYALGVVV